MSLSDHHFTNGAALADALADAVVNALRNAIAERGKASLAVSGGKTPLAFFNALSRHSLDWHNVKVTMADERWVPQTDARSNTRLVYAHLLVNEAIPARFVPLVNEATSPEAGLAAVTAGLSTLPLPFDVVILGMGDDGHTASWFPHGDHLAEALDMNGTALLVPMRAAGAPEPRITFTAPALLAARNLFLHFEGAGKRAIFDKANGAGQTADMPIRAALRAQRTAPLQIYWSS